MIYLIKGKPYVKVANYYKEIKIQKNGNEYNAEPKGGEETRIENPNPLDVTQMTVEEFYKSQKTKTKENSNYVEENDEIK